MKKSSKIGVALLLALSFSCKDAGPKSEESMDQLSASETVESPAEASSTEAKEATASAAAVEPKNSKRKVIRKADIKFKVKNVPKSTYAIEDATTKFGGFVTYTNLESNVSSTNDTRISQDSTLITTKYTVVNDIAIRIPNTRLDTVIKVIAKQIEFLDYRLITADDVTLQLLANQMSQNRSNRSEKRIEKAIDTKGKKLNQIIDAEDHLDGKSEQNDQKKLENLAMKDQISFSTLSLKIYQNEAVRQEMVANEKSVNAYRPNIGLQIWDSLKTGWFMLEGIIAFIVQLWGIVLIGFLVWSGYKKFLRK
jgi:Domain of unknown function (DUF4349)